MTVISDVHVRALSCIAAVLSSMMMKCHNCKKYTEHNRVRINQTVFYECRQCGNRHGPAKKG